MKPTGGAHRHALIPGPDTQTSLKTIPWKCVDWRQTTRGAVRRKVWSLFQRTTSTKRPAQRAADPPAAPARLFIFAFSLCRGGRAISNIGGVRCGSRSVGRGLLLCCLPVGLGCFFFAVGAAFFGVGAAFFGVGRCWGCFGFSYLCLVVGSCSSAGAPFPSAAAVVRVFGWSRVFGWFALAVLRVPVSPGLSRSGRVAAACPRFASWLCGHLGCSWWVGWSVACACAASLGVSVGSGGVPAPGVQLSLFS